jgi:flagellar L-ring protein precursor FlgH
MYNKSKTIRLIPVLLGCCALTACGAGERLSNIGKPPEMAQIVNPQLQQDYKPVTMPMPSPKFAARSPNSLWDTNRNSFFKDQRAADIGDVLTVNITIDDKAQLDNETERTRSASEGAGIPKLFGGETQLGQVFNEAVDPTNLVEASSDSGHKGSGSIDRKEKINVKLAAVVTQILPNGNFVINGKQEIRINFEKRILQVMGIIRPEDISIANAIDYDQIAEARIVYGGEGQITDFQQPRYGQQAFDVLMPF